MIEPDSHNRHEALPLNKVHSDKPFLTSMTALGASYVILLLAMLGSMLAYTTPHHIGAALASPEIRYAIRLSLISCTITSVLSLWVAVPIGYLMSHYKFRGKSLLDAVLDIPIVLPPLVVGLGLLILFTTPMGKALDNGLYSLTKAVLGKGIGIKYDVAGVVLAQFMVACAFAVRTMRAVFDDIDPRREEVALTLGCSRSEAFWNVVFPEARRGMVVAGTLAWARALGEFGPLLIFAGAIRNKTEVLPTTVFLELSVGDIEAAVAVSLFMIASAIAVLMVVRILGRPDRREL